MDLVDVITASVVTALVTAILSSWGYWRKAKADLLQPRLLHTFYGSHPLAEERIRAAEDFAAGH